MKMMTIEEIETAYDPSQVLDFSQHELGAPALSLKEMFYPLGFPAEVRTNSNEVLELMAELWGNFEQQHDTEPIRTDVHVVEEGAAECPQSPVYRIMLPLVTAVADANNYSIVNLETNRTQTSISRATLKHPLYAKYFLLGNSACCIATRFTTPVHSACVALEGHGVLLCGDSGAGKSTLSYACARSGWTYVCDDGLYLKNCCSDGRVGTGDCFHVRFRPSAAELFPEVQGLGITPRATGKPSVELSTSPMSHVARAQSTHIDYMVFLNRRAGGTPELRPYRADIARQWIRQGLYGSPESLASQYRTIERLLTAEIFELRYTDLDWAVDRLQTLVREGL
jgi:hypothetical protein